MTLAHRAGVVRGEGGVAQVETGPLRQGVGEEEGREAEQLDTGKDEFGEAGAGGDVGQEAGAGVREDRRVEQKVGVDQTGGCRSGEDLKGPKGQIDIESE